MLALVDKARDESASIPQCFREMQEPVKFRRHILVSESGGVRVQEQFDGILRASVRAFAWDEFSAESFMT